MSHSDRCRFLRERGWTIDAGCNLPDMGQVFWIERDNLTAWLAVRDGFVRIHGPIGEDLTWEQFTEWLEPKQVEPEKPKAKQRSMFDE